MGIVTSLTNKYAFPVKAITPYRCELPLETLDLGCMETAVFSTYGSVEKKDQIVIYAHGNCETVYLCDLIMQMFAELYGGMFVCFDWPAYGDARGRKPGEKGLLKAAEAVYTEMHRRHPSARIVVWGRSIGTVAASYLAEKHELACILQSPMASAFNVVCDPPRCTCVDRLNNAQRVPKLTNDLLIIHGERDSVVDYHNALLLVCAATGLEFDEVLSKLENANAEAEKTGKKDAATIVRIGKLTFCSLPLADHNDIEMCFLDAQTTCVAPLLSPERSLEEIRTHIEQLEAQIELAMATKLSAQQAAEQKVSRETCVL